MYCGNCGKSFKEDNKFCPHCGSVNDFFEKTSENIEESVPSQDNTSNTGNIEQPKKRKLKTWKKVLIAISASILLLAIGVSGYFLTCFVTHKPYKTETDGAEKTEYYFGDKLTDRIRISYNEFGNVEYISKREKKVIDNNNCLIESGEDYIYDDNQKLEYKSGHISGEPGVYEHKYVIDAQDNYISNEIWRLGEDNNEIIIEDSANNTKTIRNYEEYKIKEDDYDYLSNSDKLCLMSGGGFKKDGTQYFFVTRLIKEEHTDNENPDNNYVSTIHYGEEKIVEKEVEADGSIYVIEYDLTGEEINSYWLDE